MVGTTPLPATPYAPRSSPRSAATLGEVARRAGGGKQPSAIGHRASGGDGSREPPPSRLRRTLANLLESACYRLCDPRRLSPDSLADARSRGETQDPPGRSGSSSPPSGPPPIRSTPHPSPGQPPSLRSPPPATQPWRPLPTAPSYSSKKRLTVASQLNRSDHFNAVRAIAPAISVSVRTLTRARA